MFRIIKMFIVLLTNAVNISNHTKCLSLSNQKCNSNHKWNNDKCQSEWKKHDICKKDYIRNPATCENGKYLASIMDDSAITFDEIIDAEANSSDVETVPTNFNEKNITCKTQNFYILFDFLLITIPLLIPVNIYSYLIKYQAKQNHFLPFHDTGTELKHFCVN